MSVENAGFENCFISVGIFSGRLKMVGRITVSTQLIQIQGQIVISCTHPRGNTRCRLEMFQSNIIMPLILMGDTIFIVLMSIGAGPFTHWKLQSLRDEFSQQKTRGNIEDCDVLIVVINNDSSTEISAYNLIHNESFRFKITSHVL
jgi:hypothetical protein